MSVAKKTGKLTVYISILCCLLIAYLPFVQRHFSSDSYANIGTIDTTITIVTQPMISKLFGVPAPDRAATFELDKIIDNIVSIAESQRKIWYTAQGLLPKFVLIWKAAIASRTAGTGCPYCAQRIQYRRKLI